MVVSWLFGTVMVTCHGSLKKLCKPCLREPILKHFPRMTAGDFTHHHQFLCWENQWTFFGDLTWVLNFLPPLSWMPCIHINKFVQVKKFVALGGLSAIYFFESSSGNLLHKADLGLSPMQARNHGWWFAYLGELAPHSCRSVLCALALTYPGTFFLNDSGRLYPPPPPIFVLLKPVNFFRRLDVSF